MLSMRLSALLKCGWRNGFTSAGSKKKKEPLTVGLTGLTAGSKAAALVLKQEMST